MKIDIAWISLFLVLGFLIYAAFSIKFEKKNAKKNQKSFRLGNIKFNTPPWWSVLEESLKLKVLKREDIKG